MATAKFFQFLFLHFMKKKKTASLPMRITYGLHKGDEYILNSLDMSLLKLNSDFTDAQKVTKEKDYLQI